MCIAFIGIHIRICV